MSDDNIWTVEWDEGEDWSGGGAKAKRLPRGEKLGATVYELGPPSRHREMPEVCEYPELGQITAQAPTASQTGERLWFIYDVPQDG